MTHFAARLPRVMAAAAGLLMLGGCATDGYYGGVDAGYGYGDAYYGSGGYYAPGGAYYGGAGYGGFGGWYNDFYYPGSGYYVFDRGGNRHRWNDNQRSYWERRRAERPDRGQGNQPGRPDVGWQGNGGQGGPGRGDGRPYWNNGNGRPDGNDRPGRGGQWNDQAQPNSVPMNRADRKSVREFGATIEQRRADDAASMGRPYVPGGGRNGPVQSRGNRDGGQHDGSGRGRRRD